MASTITPPAAAAIDLDAGGRPSVDEIVERLRADGRLVHVERLPARPARVGELAEPLPDHLGHLIPPSGLWSHQVEAIDHVRNGRSVVVATGTASGKSTTYQIPVAEVVTTRPRPGSALLLFPTKALAQDQLRAFHDLDVDGLSPVSYDGDTPRSERTWARRNANVVLTNPEMLHHGILPHHGKWATFLGRLDIVVVDELHVLRGVFGTHVAHVLRRLQRLCARYGSSPTFVFCSATIGEPGRLAAELCTSEVAEVTDDGSPCAERHVGIVRPAMVDVDTGRRQSSASETIQLVGELVAADRRVIAFCASRSLTERVASGVRRSLPPALADSVRSYRAGYLAEERRQIEGELHDGSVRAVATTSALELGVDIGGLDATVLCGFPGTIASFWQQIGRAGRNGQTSLALLVAGEDQLDQWFAAHPRDLFDRPPEPVVVNVANPHIAHPHLACGAYEMPLEHRDDGWWPELDDGVRDLVRSDHLRVRRDRTRLPRAFWAGRGIPGREIGLRSASGGEVRIVDTDDRLVGTTDAARACHRVHPGAIYLHRGQPWQVQELALDERRAVVTPADGEAWTQALSDIAIDVVDTAEARPVGRSTLHLGSVTVTTTVTGYQRREPGSRRNGERPETIPLDLPPQVLHTTAIWYEWDPSVIEAAGVRPFALPGALHAAEHAAIGILPLFTICDRWDVGGVSIAAAPHTGLPTVFIHDGYPGGAGVAELAFAAAEDHLAATAEVLADCPCVRGCPSCVQSPKCGNGNEPLDKHAALALVTTTLGTADPF